MNNLDRGLVENVLAQEKAWEANEVAQFLKKQKERQEAFFTLGDIPVKREATFAILFGDSASHHERRRILF